MKKKMKIDDDDDRLSALPDEVVITVLSLLPTLIAARTSVLSRRFRHLWKASPSVDLPFTYISPSVKHSTYFAMANSVLFSRRIQVNKLHLEFDASLFSNHDLTESFFSSLLVHAHALGLRHLTIHGNGGQWDFETVLLSVLSSCISLESLSIHVQPLPLKTTFPFPSPIFTSLTRLKSLSINFIRYCNSIVVEQLISELCCLEDLQLHIFSLNNNGNCLSSRTIKKLDLLLVVDTTHLGLEPYSLRLSMPSLEFLCLRNRSFQANVPLIHGDIPFIKKALLTLDGLRQKHITAVAQFLNFISSVEELTLDLKEHRWEEYPFPVLLEPVKEAPTFSNLKHLDMSICFHECNFEALVTMLHHSTALESLKLHDKISDILEVKSRKINAWRSKLPHKYQYACFKNLHLGENRKEFKKLLNNKCTPKRQPVGN